MKNEFIPRSRENDVANLSALISFVKNESLGTVRDYFSFIKFSHTLFALPFALCGMLLGLAANSATPVMRLFVWILVAMVSARSAAMGFNRLVDRKIDAKNPRTKGRELPTRKISPIAAAIFVFAMSAVFVFSAWQLNMLCFYLSPIALFVILGYSYTKRFTSLSHIVLGIALGIAPLGAFIAVTGTISAIPIILALAVVCWTAGFDIIYALQDQQFDKNNNLHSIPSSIGIKNAIYLSQILHFISASLLILLLALLQFRPFVMGGTSIFILLLIYQQIVLRRHGLSRINYAFFTLNGMASLLYGAFFFIDYIYFA